MSSGSTGRIERDLTETELMKATHLREKTYDELGDELLRLKQELFNIRFQVVSGEFTNKARIRELRRDVARVRTVMVEKRASQEQA